ncbi:unnamed protein product [Porites lobata]|uniref:DUF4614 domain-containing protein n=1 Tax=Porites lobata TaxID=104759 RepID=A0ABN8RH03_9CNID|nr:unnamed protein product [Porites lobata]
MASKRQKWKGSAEKAGRMSRESLTDSRKSSVLGEETSANELAEYLETLKKKSGIKSLWKGESFDRVVRDEEDKTPDISISSMDDEIDEKLHSEKLEDVDDVDDFKVNVQMFSRSPTPTNDNSSDSSINPMKGLQMAEFAFSDDDQPDDVLANNRLEDKLKSLTVSGKDVRSVVNDLSEAAEVLTEDEVEEEIEEDVIEDETAENTKNRNRSSSRNKDISERNHLSSPRSVSDAEIRTASKQEKNRTRSQQSYTADFSSESEVRTQNSPSHSYTGSEQNTSRSSGTSKSSRSSRSSRDSRSSRRSRSSRTSRSSRSSRSHERSRSKETSTDYSKSKNKDRGNKYKCDVGVQTAPAVDQFTIPPGLGVGMATSGPRFGMQYVDPSPIATHTVSPEAMEAITAYNPAIVVLNNMLREQIRLVEQFVEINQRMYESYSSGLNNNYRYTTLEDTQQFIRKNRPKPLSYEEALEQVKREER